jgi:predicted phage terminase large subunit-like protein
VTDFDFKAAIVQQLVDRNGLLEFVRHFWSIVEPGDFRENWHIEHDCQALEAISREYRCAECGASAALDVGWRRECVCGARAWRRVHPTTVINQPPGTMKSLLVNVFWPAWVWTFEPEHRWMFVSHGDGIVLRDAEKALRILKSPLYRAAWPRSALKGGVTAKQAFGNYETLAGGARYSFSIRGGVLGWHADTIVTDDPIKPSQAEAPSGIVLEEVERTYSGSIYTRRRDPATFGEVLIMQRLADGDLSDVFLARGAEHICLPMQYVPDCSWDHGHRFGFEDPRSEPGELLWPARFPADIVASDLEQFTPATAAAQYQQNPTPSTGAFFEADWFREYDALPPDWSLTFFQVWDLGFKGRDRGSAKAVESRSRVHGALWAWDPPRQRALLVDEKIGRWNYPDTRSTFLAAQTEALWSRSIAVIVEDKANGTALISELREIVPAIYPWEPAGSKEDRARRHSARVASGVVWIPSVREHSWAGDFRAELVKFPRQKVNDRVDTTTMLLDFLYQPGGIARSQLQGLVEFFERP